MNIDWKSITAVVFDVDGTLYNQHQLRHRMWLDMFGHYAFRPWLALDLLLLHRFRTAREQLADQGSLGIRERQYENLLPGPLQVFAQPNRVRRLVARWMEEQPLRHLEGCKYPGVSEFIALLGQRQIKVGFFSDYPADRKLHALGIAGFPSVSAVDPDVDALKPSPNGLTKILRLLQAVPSNCLCIGDRDERDGECARRSGVRFLLKSQDERPGDVFVSYWQLIGSLGSRDRRAN